MKFILNRKSMMTFGKWSLALFSLVLLGVFIVQYVIPILALDPPTKVDNINVTLIHPANNAYTNGANFTYNVSWDTIFGQPTNCTLFGNFTGTFASNVTNTTTITNNAYNIFNATKVTDGKYIWNVYCYNATSHGNYSNSNYTVTVDLTDPVLRNPYPSNNSYINNANVVFNVSLTEQNINYTVNATLYYRKSSQTDWQTQTLQCWNNAPSFTCNYSAINLGTAPIWLLDTNVLQFFYNTTDSAGRTSQNGTAGAPLIVTLDTTQPTSVPTVTHSDDAPTGYDNDTTLDFTWTAASDTTSGVQYYKIYVRENNSAYVYNGTNSSTLGYSFTGGNGNTYSINVTTVDNANNENTTGTVSSTITVDTTQPSSPGTVYFKSSPTDYYDNSTTLVINWTASSDTNGIQYYKIYVRENAGAYVYNGTNSAPLGYSFTGSDGKNYSVNVTAVDNAGIENITGTVSNTTIYIDTTDPASPTDVAFEADPTTSYDNDNTLVVNWTAATDATSGVQYYKIYVSENSGAYVYNGTNNTKTGYNFTGANGKNYRVNVTAIDNVNRENTTGTLSSTTITVDTTQPSSPSNVAFEADPTTSYDNDGTLVINWTAATDTNGILNYKIYVSENSGAYVYNGTNSSATGYSFTGANGKNYTVNVTANDTAYNENTTGTLSSTTITVDTTSPTTILTVSPTLANSSYTSNNWVYVNVTFTETNPNTCLLQFNNGTASNYTMSGAGTTNCYINMTSQPDGDWNYSVFVNDSANNWGSNGTYFVTVDTVNPIINETVPVNGTYFNNPSSMIFQVKLTEQNRNNSVNVTVYWKLQGAPSYTSNTLNCYGSAPTWVCNITGINTGLTNGQVLQFLFNTTDSAGRTATNGTATNPLTATVDLGAPTYTNNNTNTTVAGKYDTVLIYAYWTDADTLKTAVLETNETGTAANKTTGCPNYPCTLSGSTSWSNFTWSNSSVTVGTVIVWKIYANDSANNQNVTSQGTFSTDNTKPTYTNNGTSVSSGSTIGKGTSILLYAQWTDNVKLHGWIVENNASGGSLTNTTFNTTFYTGDWTNYTITTSASAGTTIHARIYVNDTSGNENFTVPTWTWTIDNTPPTYTSNGTNITSGSTIVKGTPISVYALWTDGIQLGSGWVQENITTPGTMSNTSITFSGNWTNTSLSTSSLTAGSVYMARLFANDTSGNENFTVPTWTWTIDGTAPTYWNKSDSVSGEAVYTPGKSYILNISWTDDLGVGNVSTVLLNFSSLSTNQTATSLGNSNYSVTLTDLGFGNYTYKWFANDTSGNWNQTVVYTLNITQNTTTSSWMNLTLGNGTSVAEANNSVMYPHVNNATGYYNSNVFTGQTMTFTLYKNNTAVGINVVGTNTSVSDNTRYAADTVYKYVYNTSGNVNYSSASKEFWLTVIQNNTNPIDIYIRNTTDAYKNANVTDSAGHSITVNATSVYGNETELKLYSNVSGSEAQVSNLYTFTPSSANVTTFKANVTTTNYTSNQTITFYLIITSDSTAPAVLLYDYTNGTVKKSGAALSLNISVSDATGVTTGDTCNVTINNVVNTTITHSNGWCNGTITVPNVGSDGNYTINITVKDNSTSHNVGFNASYVLTVDNTTPVITSLTPVNNTYNKVSGAYHWVNGTAYDLIKMGSGNITISGNNASSFTVYNFTGSNNTVFAVYNNTTVSDGLVQLTFTYIDNATNSISAAVQFYVDNTPTTSFTAITTGTKAKSATQTVEVNVTDNLMTNASITLHYYRYGYDASWQTITMTGTPGATTTYSANINTNVLGITIVGYFVSGVDNATNTFSINNGTETSPLGNFTVGDITAPNSPASITLAQVGSTKEINISWSASTSSDTVAYNVYYKLNGAVTTSDNSFRVGNVTKTSWVVGSDGNWNFTVTAIDSSNNEGSIIAANNITIITTDTTAPNNPASVSVTQFGSTKQINISWSASTSSDVVRYNVYYKLSGAVTTSDNSFSVGNVTKASIAVGSDGNWNFTVTAIDSSNNENTTIVTSANITIDTTAPGVSSTSPNGTISDNTPTLVINTTENGYCKFDAVDKTMSTMIYTMTGSGTGHEYTFSSVLSDSVYTYYVRCNDTTGNEMTTTSISFNLDTTSLFNITRPEYWPNYFTANKWWFFALPLWTIQSTTLTYYNVTSVLSSVSGKYNSFYADIGNNNTWRSYVPGRTVNSFTDFTYNGSASIYYIYTNTTDRIEIN